MNGPVGSFYSNQMAHQEEDQILYELECDEEAQ